MRTSWVIASAFLAVLTAGASAAVPARPVDGALGAYVLNGTAKVRVTPFPAREQPGKVLVTLGPGRTPGHVSVRLESHGYSCVLDASRSRAGDLAFTIPASCAADVRETDARGRIDAHLQSGQGTVRDGRLALDLRFDVSGKISTRIARRTYTLFQTEFTVPGGWTPSVPVRGTVTSGGSGARKRSG